MTNTTIYQPETPLIDIDDRHLHLTGDRHRRPPVIFESGLGETWESWLPIQAQVAQFTRVYRYDRAGLGKSDPARVPRTCQDMVDDLRNLLDVAKVELPYDELALVIDAIEELLVAAQ